MIKVFISYSYDNEDHKLWVTKLANDLESYEEFHVIFDRYDLTNRNDKNFYMESGVYDSDCIIIVATANYSEKADSREGGVGIETFMTTAKDWDNLVKEKESNTIFVIRDNEQKTVPRFGKGKLYINFNDDSSYSKKFKELLTSIQNIPKTIRPKKSKTVTNKEKYLQLDKIKEILQINYKKLKLIRTETDYSSSFKIKYDLWQAKTPAKIYYLVLYDNITIKQTVERFIHDQKIIPNEITVLRSNSTGYIEKLFSEHNKKVNINEFSFSEFMWDFCIDDELKDVEKNYQDEYYIDQKIFKYENNKKQILGTSNKYIEDNFINNLNSASILLVLAPGGMGKSTMCDVISNTINSNDNQRAILIKSEDFKNHENPNFFKSFSIESVYDLYEVYNRVTKKTTLPKFSKDLFDISFLCGNLIILIDGLDELISIFQDNFNIKSFVKSLIDLNQQLGQAKIIVTSRENYWKENSHINEIEEEIDEINLLGFDEETWEKYLINRFEKFPDKEKCINKIKKHIGISELSDDGIIIPFFVDVLSALVHEDFSSSASSNPKISFDNRDYSSNSNLIDYLVYVLLDREITRQGYKISLRKFVAIFKDIAAEFGSTFSIENMQEVIEFHFGVASEEIYNKMLVNPFLKFTINNNGTFKYDFLGNYFISLYLIDCIKENTVNKYSIRHLSFLNNSNNQILADIAKYFSQHKIDIIKYIKIFTNTLLKEHTKSESRSYKIKIEKSISSLMYLLQISYGNGLSKQKRTELILQIYTPDKIDALFIWGNFFPIDFSQLAVWNSKFTNYSNFCKCKFEKSSFYYCIFDGIDVSSGINTIKNIYFDSTCDIGELSLLLHSSNESRKNCKLAETELKKFFRSFYDRGRFLKKLLVHISFSAKNSKIDKSFLLKLVKDGAIEYDSIGDRYFIPINFQRSVHQLLVNNLVDSNMNNLLKYICN